MTYKPVAGVERVIGITGAARHGKDAAAKILLRLLPGAERWAFSDAVAVDARVHHGMTKRDPRLLQTIGTARREQRDTVWLDVLYGAIQDRQPTVAVITGLRYPNEADMVRSMGGEVVRVVRMAADGRPFVADDRDPTHPVEQGIAAIREDHTIIAQGGDLDAIERGLRQWLLDEQARTPSED